MTSARAERGAGTVLTAGVVFALLAVAAAGIVVVGWFSLIRHAEQAAELAALAAAGAAVEGDDACRAAREAAHHNGRSVSSCTLRGTAPDVVVEVGVEVELRPRLPGVPERIERRATAGAM